jgi:hypothetical protein
MEKILKIRTNALKTLKDRLLRDINEAETFLLGGKKNMIEEVIYLDRHGGCPDTGAVDSQQVANASVTFFARGKIALGFGIVREKKGKYYHDHSDSLNDNLRTWQKNFPGCYVLLFTKKGNMVWHLRKRIKEKIKLKEVKK